MVLSFVRSYRNRAPRSSLGNGVRMVFWSFLLALSAGNWAGIAAEQSPPAATEATAKHSEDDQAIRAQSAEYAKAFANGDVSALARMWAEDAVFTDEAGTVYRGREAIRHQMADFFKRSGKQPLEVTVESVEFPSDTTAIEHGITCLVAAEPPDNMQKYTAVHVKRDGKWQMVSVTESPYIPQSSAEYLKSLNWLIGSWNAEGPAGKLHLKLDWVANGNIVCASFETDEKDGAKTSQTEYIYWNPRRNLVCSWQFDWTGGYGNAWWEKSGDNWICHARAVLSDGRLARANYLIQRVDDNTFSWQSTDRQLSGQRLPDTNRLLVKRAGV